MRLPPSSGGKRHSLSVVILTDNLTASNALIKSHPKTLLSATVSLLNAATNFEKKPLRIRHLPLDDAQADANSGT